MNAKAKRRLKLRPEHLVGEFVHLHTDPDRVRRLVTGIFVWEHGLTYQLSQGATCSVHYGFEIAAIDEAERRAAGFK